MDGNAYTGHHSKKEACKYKDCINMNRAPRGDLGMEGPSTHYIMREAVFTPCQKSTTLASLVLGSTSLCLGTSHPSVLEQVCWDLRL